MTLLLATIVMPVNYRAGADHEHAHTIFQGMIDAIIGHPHHHAGHMIDHDHLDPVSPDPDAPELLGLSMSIISFATIQALGLLVASLLAGAASRPLFSKARRLLTRTVGVEVPPPRSA